MIDTAYNWFSLLRVTHWTKSLFVFVGLLYSWNLYFFKDVLLAAIAFSFISSAIYIYNDIHDIEEDRQHPQKSSRALASGTISLNQAVIVFLFLMIAGLGIAAYVSISLLWIVSIYILINWLYNWAFKSIPILDVLCIASGFLLRVLAGTLGVGILVSSWLLMAITALSLMIAFSKRRMEKSLNLQDHIRPVLQWYTLEFLDDFIIATALTCFFTYLFYVIYVHEASFYFMLTLPFVVLGIARFLLLTFQEAKEDDPVHLVFNDPFSLITFGCFLALTIIGNDPSLISNALM